MTLNSTASGFDWKLFIKSTRSGLHDYDIPSLYNIFESVSKFTRIFESFFIAIFQVHRENMNENKHALPEVKVFPKKNAKMQTF